MSEGDRYYSPKYSSPSQAARVFSEGWALDALYCPSCGQALGQYPRNRPVADFFCSGCILDFELKSNKRPFGTRIVNGAWRTMIDRLNGGNNPSFFLLHYQPITLHINEVALVPGYFFTPAIIERRKPLSPTARRHGWIGCNILISGIPPSGRIYYIKDGIAIPRNLVLDSWNRTAFLRDETNIEARGWLLDVMNCVERLNKEYFSLKDIYSYEAFLASRYPNNRHVKDKIRQQLQYLRDRGYLEFTGRGQYRLRQLG